MFDALMLKTPDLKGLRNAVRGLRTPLPGQTPSRAPGHILLHSAPHSQIPTGRLWEGVRWNLGAVVAHLSHPLGKAFWARLCVWGGRGGGAGGRERG